MVTLKGAECTLNLGELIKEAEEWMLDGDIEGGRVYVRTSQL